MRRLADCCGSASTYKTSGYSTDPHVLAGTDEAALSGLVSLHAQMVSWGEGDITAIRVEQDTDNWELWRAHYDASVYPILVRDQLLASAGTLTADAACEVKAVPDEEGLREIARTIPTGESYGGEVVNDASIGDLNGKLVLRGGHITLDTLTDTHDVAFAIFNSNSADNTITEVGTTGLNGNAGGSIPFPRRSLAWFTVDQYGWWSVATTKQLSGPDDVWQYQNDSTDFTTGWNGRLIEVLWATAATVNLNASALQVGCRFEVVQTGAGAVSVVPGANCTLNGGTSPIALAGQWKRALVYLSAINESTHEWVICI